MAATKKPNKIQQEKTRAAIQTTQLVKRLQRFALEEKGVEIDPVRLKAIEILLRKSLPDLSAVQLSGDPENPIKAEVEHTGAEKLSKFLDGIAERSGTPSDSDA